MVVFVHLCHLLVLISQQMSIYQSGKRTVVTVLFLSVLWASLYLMPVSECVLFFHFGLYFLWHMHSYKLTYATVKHTDPQWQIQYLSLASAAGVGHSENRFLLTVNQSHTLHSYTHFACGMWMLCQTFLPLGFDSHTKKTSDPSLPLKSFCLCRTKQGIPSIPLGHWCAHANTLAYINTCAYGRAQHLASLPHSLSVDSVVKHTCGFTAFNQPSSHECTFNWPTSG